VAGVGKKVEWAVKRAAKGKATGGTTSSSGRKGGGTGKKVLPERVADHRGWDQRTGQDRSRHPRRDPECQHPACGCHRRAVRAYGHLRVRDPRVCEQLHPFARLPRGSRTAVDEHRRESRAA
jgi:hypothetical protein